MEKVGFRIIGVLVSGCFLAVLHLLDGMAILHWLTLTWIGLFVILRSYRLREQRRLAEERRLKEAERLRLETERRAQFERD
jgi:hypothetical protein